MKLVLCFVFFFSLKATGQLRDTLPPVPFWINLCDISKDANGMWHGNSKRRYWFAVECLCFVVRKNGKYSHEYYTDLSGNQFSQKEFLKGKAFARKIDTNAMEDSVVIDANFNDL